MKLKTVLKIIASIILLLTILAALLLFGSIRNIQSVSNQSMLIPYYCIFGIIIFSFVLFLLFMFSDNGRESLADHSFSTKDFIEEETTQGNRNSSEKTYDLNDLNEKARGFVPQAALAGSAAITLKDFAEASLSQIAKVFPIIEGIFYLRDKESEEFSPLGDYAYFSEKPPGKFKLGETLPGQVAKNKRPMNLSDIPADYIKAASGLGQGSPKYLYFLPLLNKDEVLAVIELASFTEFDAATEKLFELGANELSAVLVKIETRN